MDQRRRIEKLIIRTPGDPVTQKGQRATVWLKPTCNDRVTADIRVRAKEAGKTATVVGKSVKVAKKPFTACKANANG